MNLSSIAPHKDAKSLCGALRDTLFETDLKLRRAHENHLGYPTICLFPPASHPVLPIT